MTPKEQAEQMYKFFLSKTPKPDIDTYKDSIKVLFDAAKDMSIRTTQMIINCNPHSNPFNNSTQESTMKYWNEVLNELKDM